MFLLQSTMSAERAYAILQAFTPCPEGTCVAENDVDIQYDLQIIIPAYNVEKYIGECLTSVLLQETHYRCLVTVVNDGSTDRTGDIVNKYLADSKENLHLEVITQHNRGFSGARNVALRTIRGCYVMLIDSDDVLHPKAIEKMMDVAYSMNADILQGSWYHFSEAGGKTSTHICPYEGILEDNQGILSGYPWGKLYKYTVMQHFQFPEGFWFEDTPVSFILAAMPYTFAATKEVVYGYRQNPTSITATAAKRKKVVDTYWVTQRCLQDFPAFGLKYDQRAYEYLLRQSIMNWQRTRYQPRKIREAIFVLTHDLVNEFFARMSTSDKTMEAIETAIRKKQFAKYELLLMGR